MQAVSTRPEAKHVAAQLAAVTGFVITPRTFARWPRGQLPLTDFSCALTSNHGMMIEFLGAGPTWSTALEDALRWWPARSRLRPCTEKTHRDLYATLRHVLRGGTIADPRAAHWMRTRRPWPGHGLMGECVCGGSLVVIQTTGDREFVAELIARIGKKHGLDPTDVLGIRDRRSTGARAEIVHELRDLEWSYGRIAAVFGCHPTAVMYLDKKKGV